MASPSILLPFAVEEALAVVRDAAALALRLRSGVSVEIKADDTLVTEADRAIEALLREKLGQLAPDWSFLGEEGGLQGNPDAPCWVIDPIDGTTNYARDLPLWCISVGAVWRGEPIFGVISVPEIGQTLWAAQGQGAWEIQNDQTRRLSVLDSVPLQQEDLIASNTTVERVIDFSAVPCRLRNFGSLAYHLAALGRGSVVAIIAHYHKLYDVAAGLCICLEAGCEVKYIDGEAWQAHVSTKSETKPMLCAPPQVLALLLDKLTPKIKSEAIKPAQDIQLGG